MFLCASFCITAECIYRIFAPNLKHKLKENMDVVLTGSYTIFLKEYYIFNSLSKHTLEVELGSEALPQKLYSQRQFYSQRFTQTCSHSPLVVHTHLSPSFWGIWSVCQGYYRQPKFTTSVRPVWASETSTKVRPRGSLRLWKMKPM